jgi:selenocysteine lyase/cysteine desulfurase
MHGRGGTLALNFLDARGHVIDHAEVERRAAGASISLRTGCFCNPGPGEAAEDITEEDIVAGLAANPDLTLPLFLQMITHRGGKSAGAIRVSFGIASNFADAQRFYEFAASLRDQTRLTIGEATFDIESCRVIRDGS